MYCELCGSSKRLPKRKLCEACAEAITRLWAIAGEDEVAIASRGKATSGTDLGWMAAETQPTVAKV